MYKPTTTLLTEEALKLAAGECVACVYANAIGMRGFDVKGGELGRDPERGGGLVATFAAVAYIRDDGLWGGGPEADGSTLASALHDFLVSGESCC